MEEQELGGNIKLVKFDFEPQEMVVVKKIVGNYAKKIRNYCEYQELRLEMNKHKKGKRELVSLKANLIYQNGANQELAMSEKIGYNPYVMISEVLEKVLHEIEHKIKKQS